MRWHSSLDMPDLDKKRDSRLDDADIEASLSRFQFSTADREEGEKLVGILTGKKGRHGNIK
jgi:hypothetical protein